MVQISIDLRHSLSIIHIPRHALIEASLHGQKEVGEARAFQSWWVARCKRRLRDMKVISPGVMGPDLAGLAGMSVNLFLDANSVQVVVYTRRNQQSG